METKNVTISNLGWQDVETLGSFTFVNNTPYTVSILGSGRCETCIAENQPQNTFKGHPLKDDESFTFTYAGAKLWIKTSPFDGTVTVVIS